MISCTNLSVYLDGKQILKNLNWSSYGSSLWVILGPNGAGKSTFLHALAGTLQAQEQSGAISLDYKDITSFSSFERFHNGIMLAYQNPPEIEGLSIIQLLTTMMQEKAKQQEGDPPSTAEVLKRVKEAQKLLQLPEDFYTRMVHSGLSGGQKKLLELLQVLVVQPRYVLLDEIDSGLDIVKQKIVKKVIETLTGQGSIVVYVTHSLGLARELQHAQFLLIVEGEKKREGGVEIADIIQEHGYDYFAR